MNKSFIALTVYAVFVTVLATVLLLIPGHASPRRINAALGQFFYLDGEKYTAIRSHPTAEHIVCLSENGVELVVNVGTVENLVQFRANRSAILREIVK